MKSSVVKNPERERRPLIGVVDADASVRGALQTLIRSHGYDATSYASAEEVPGDLSRFDLLIVGEELPGMSGVEMLEKVQARGLHLPSIVLTSAGDIPLTVRAMRAGAADCLEKPFFQLALLKRVEQVLSESRTG